MTYKDLLPPIYKRQEEGCMYAHGVNNHIFNPKIAQVI